MGCMCSKSIARSMSIREELNHGFRCATAAVAWEELLVYSPQTSHATLPHPEENNDSGIITESREDKCSAGSRSFHTVEEYEDVLLERIRKFSTRSVHHFEDCGDCSSASDVEVRAINHDLDEDQEEAGWKRKVAGKQLEPLDVSTIDFPDTGRWRQQWVRAEGGIQVYSPGGYVTPKFGSYNERVVCRAQEKDSGENSVLSRELVAAFEDCMQQLEDEEDSFFRQMDGHDFPPNDVQIDVTLSMKNDT